MSYKFPFMRITTQSILVTDKVRERSKDKCKLSYPKLSGE